MKSVSLCLLLLLLAFTTYAQKADTRLFELRIYYATTGKMDVLLERFRGHTTKIFERHGMENIGYWLPVTNDHNALYYILAFPSKDARDKSWKAFGEDPEWKEVKEKTEANGKIVDSVKSIFMTSAEILPAIAIKSTNPQRSFELRTYTCYPDKLPNLIARFKDHTVNLFIKHQKENIAYFKTEEKNNGQPKLVYILADKSTEDASKSWTAFRADAEWIAARDASEKDGKIVEKVESVFLKPLDFSKIQ